MQVLASMAMELIGDYGYGPPDPQPVQTKQSESVLVTRNGGTSVLRFSLIVSDEISGGATVDC